jgi:hypothetical protein
MGSQRTAGRRHPHQRLVGACQCPASQQRYQQCDRVQARQGQLGHATAAHHNLLTRPTSRIAASPTHATAIAGSRPTVARRRHTALWTQPNHRGANPTMSSAKGRLSGYTRGGSPPAVASDRRGRPSQPGAPRWYAGSRPAGDAADQAQPTPWIHMQVGADEGDVMEPATVLGTPGAQALATGRNPQRGGGGGGTGSPRRSRSSAVPGRRSRHVGGNHSLTRARAGRLRPPGFAGQQPRQLLPGETDTSDSQARR